jgi:hypothetical protein
VVHSIRNYIAIYGEPENSMKLISILLLLLADITVLAQTAPPVTGIHAIQQDGQTFITWNDVAIGETGSNYRYNLYRSTKGRITSLTSATLIQQGIYNNSGQLIGPKPFNQATRQNVSNPMSKITSGDPAVAPWTGIAVYTNVSKADAYYAVITHDITGATTDSPISLGSNSMTKSVAESVGAIVPVLQIPGTDPSRQIGCRDCNVTSASIGQPLWLRLHGSGGTAAAWGDYWAYWGNPEMGYQDGIQSMFAIYQDPTGNVFQSGFANQLILTPQDAVWSEESGGNSLSAKAESETFWYGLYSTANFPNAYNPVTNTAAYAFPSTKNKLSLIVPWVIAHYQPDTNRIFAWGESMGGYGSSVWALRQPNLFAGVFMAVPIIGPWLKIPQIDYGAASGIVSVTNGSPTVTLVSGQEFGLYLAGPTTVFNLMINGTVKTVSSINSPTQLTIRDNWLGASGTYSYVTMNNAGSSCYEVPAACGANLTTIDTTSVDTLPNGVTQYNNDTNTPAWISANCGLNIPYVSWAAGRIDTTTAGMWNMSVLFGNALAQCHLGFSFAWANGYHAIDTADLLRPLISTYAPQLRLNTSYPAFTSFSLDSNYGDGSTTNGDCTTGNPSLGPVCYVNYGWSWSTPIDTPTEWSATVTNSQLTSGTCPTTNCATTATVSVTPRNAQAFKPAPGSTVTWTASGGQSGSVVVDSYGLATVVGVNLTTNATTITFSTQP